MNCLGVAVNVLLGFLSSASGNSPFRLFIRHRLLDRDD